MDAALHISSLPQSTDRGSLRQVRRTPGISLVLPALNEEEVITQAICEADEALAGITSDYEILVVDDGSTDSTREVALREASRRPAVRVVVHEQNRGYGAALRSGFQAATKDYVGFTDADCQFQLNELNRLVLLLSSCDIACGYRIDRQDSWLRRLYSKIYNFLVRLLLGTRVRDCDCALKLFRRQTLAELSIDTNGFLVNAEMLSKANLLGKKVIEVGVSHRPRPRGQSTVNVWHTIPVFAALVRYWWSTILFPAHVTRRSRLTQTWHRGKSSAAAASLCLLSAAMFFGNLAYPFIEPDESRYAQIALEMIQSGDYIVPRLNGEPYLDKPPMLYWATAASFGMFGLNELAARLPSAMAATLTVLLTFLLGGRLFGHRMAYLAAVMLFLCLGFVLSGRFVIMDGLLTLFTTACLLASFLAIRERQVHMGWWLIAATACALGILTKGPISVVLTVPPLLALQWLSRHTARIQWRHWLVFASLVGTLTIPWFIAVGCLQPEFMGYFLWKHHILRFLTAFNHEAPFWYYVPVLLIGMFPCSVLAAPILAFLGGRTAALRRVRTEELGAVVLAAVWILAFFSASSCKLPTYILPAVPLLCLILGAMLNELLKGTQQLTALDNLTHHLPLHATTAACLIGGSMSIADLILRPDHGWGQVANCTMIAVAAVFLGYRVLQRQPWPKRTVNWLVAAGACFLIMAFAFQKFVPEFAGYRSIHANAARLQVTPNGNIRSLVYLDWQCDGYSFYLPYDNIRQFTEDDLEQLAQYVREHSECLFVANPRGAELLQDELGDAATFTRAAGARGRLYVVSSTAGPPPVVGTRPLRSAQR